MPGKELLYWDSCVFIAHIQNEKRVPEEMAGVEEMVKAIDKGSAILMTSVLTRLEVLDCKLTDAQRTKFEQLLKKSYVQSIQISTRVIERAAQIRNYYAGLGGDTVSTPDAVHLASAMLYQAKALYTFDGAGGRKSARGALNLIPLSGTIAGHKLQVLAPRGTPSLLTGVGPQKDSQTPAVPAPPSSPPRSS